MKRSRKVPVWLRRLGTVKAEMKTVRFPRTAQEGFRQCAELSATAERWHRQSIRHADPEADEEGIERQRRLLLARLCVGEARRIAKWNKELSRYFGE